MMYTLSITMSFLSVFGLFATHKRVEVEKKGVLLWLSQRSLFTKIISLITFIVSTYLLALQLGVAIGIFTSLTLWMLLACLTTLFSPFEKVRRGHLLIALISISAIEVLTDLLKH